MPQARSRIQSDRSGEIIGGAISQVGDQFARAHARKEQERSRFNYATARSQVLQADIAARKELEGDQDWATFEPRYRERMKADVEKASKLITDPRDRALFDQEVKFDLERGALEIGSLSRRIETDVGRSKLEEMMSLNREAALTAKDAGTRKAIVDSTLAGIDGASKPSASGTVYVSSEAAGTMRRKWIEDYGEGFVDLQTPEQQIVMLDKPDGTPAQFIPADRRQFKKEAAQNEMRRREAEARARQGEVREALRESESDALAARASGLQAQLPSRGLYLVAYGAEDGAKRHGMATQLMATYDAASAAILKPRAEGLAEIDKFRPMTQEGAADQTQVQHQARVLYEQQRKGFEADPAGYILGQDARVQELLPAILGGMAKPEDVSAYVGRMRSIQKEAGIDVPRLLPADAQDAFVNALKPDPANPGSRAVKLAQIEEQWGRHYPALLREVVPKMEGVAQILPFIPRAAAERLDAVSADPAPVLDAVKRSGRTKDLNAALQDELTAFNATLPADAVVGGAGTAEQYFEASNLLASDYVRGGMTPEKAAKLAVDQVVRSQYATDGSLRIPHREDGGRGREVSPEKVTAGARAQRDKLIVEGQFLVNPLPKQTVEEAQADMRALIRQSGVWIANDDETGAHIAVPGYGVVDAPDGEPVNFTWADLEKAGIERQEFERRQNTLDLTRRSGFGGPR